ncbi:hypothetical protein LUW75_01520 [Streptomyces sp. MRC013]|uniref:DUF6777 domain-containing protein n=1 Tax=Streptomyces sp. MRC013 TaxID=2898276 RepID=UPI002026BCFD|nr:DUF6777 domain-containing protein [Streptomyces sp. MRC013]URM88917.1 hypothetical protein LUW75_01520 [Streptomyces sp. MRC013]
MRPPTRHPTAPSRRPVAASLAVLAGLFAAGCGGDGERPAARPSAADPRPLLQPAAEPGPDPFSPSTALTADHSAARRPPSPAASGGPSAAPAGGAPRTVDGATPGLYGGTHSLPSCDVDQQARLLSADGARARAFAQAAGVTPSGLGAWLSGLTPVTLRADTRVTGHGYRDGAAVPHPAVLQAGTAVLVDRYGAPRVRCAAGNPLRAPADAGPPTGYRGEPWPGFRPDRVVLVSPTQQVLDSLLLVNVLNGAWLERAIGTRGGEDREPAVPPAYDPDDRHVADGPVPDGARTAAGAHPAAPAVPREPAARRIPGPPPAPADPPSAPPDGADPDSPARRRARARGTRARRAPGGGRTRRTAVRGARAGGAPARGAVVRRPRPRRTAVRRVRPRRAARGRRPVRTAPGLGGSRGVRRRVPRPSGRCPAIR